ncbi:class I SAM-dependent methyltransferase [Blastococcus tunisiensis]|uniref:Methyltransferase domain-containing protein n=1 Tax=Blastococcus tunisiensis TaxID=1798228 RepID=A0A1I2FEJ0_9ACTN|nr:class I SAM-dependent methyltransferase [Blastococcus sp. DSM 46838]SFF02911.1 Methyltransferase domain-containing protein [Blastococcus sp. DSM 46838]
MTQADPSRTVPSHPRPPEQRAASPEPPSGGALGDRLVAAVIGAFETAAVDLGARLGWYRALADAAATPPELAARTGSDARYAREWLEQQAVAGYLTVDDVAAAPDVRRYTLPEEHRAVLVDELDPAFAAPLARAAMAFTRNVPRLAEVYRTGDGLSWAEMGSDAREAQAGANRPFFAGPLVTEVLPAIPAVDAVLRAGGRVADVGCGFGWSALGIAGGYPAARVDGFDVDAPSIEAARRNAVDAGLDGRARFTVADVGTLAGERAYDLVAAFECVHDMPDPVAVLAAMRAMVRPGGTVLVVDEKVADTFTAPGDEVERLMYGYSLTCCLPDGRSTTPSVATGTVMRPAVLEGYARAAGFSGLEVLPVEHDVFRFYRLVHG